jgi:hypothetical protein
MDEKPPKLEWWRMPVLIAFWSFACCVQLTIESGAAHMTCGLAITAGIWLIFAIGR